MLQRIAPPHSTRVNNITKLCSCVACVACVGCVGCGGCGGCFGCGGGGPAKKREREKRNEEKVSAVLNGNIVVWNEVLCCLIASIRKIIRTSYSYYLSYASNAGIFVQKIWFDKISPPLLLGKRCRGRLIAT